MSPLRQERDKSHMKPEHGTLQAYIVGFILSLAFTFIPYYLVTHLTTTGTKLLAIILGFGVFQMLVQLLFFLHLGRKPRPHWQILFLGGTVFAVLVVTVGSLIITTNLHHNMMPTDQVLKLANDEGIADVGGKPTGACQAVRNNHQVMIVDGEVFPEHTDAKQCDTLTFMNHESKSILIGFGEHPQHTAYAGEDDLVIRSGKNETITLSELGAYNFHDHLHEATAGSFTVSQ
jgi:cytochrome o ubiquinol oxidase operon protein cyoD